MNASKEILSPEAARIHDLMSREALDRLPGNGSEALALRLAKLGRREVKRSWFHAMIAAFPLSGSTGLQFMRLAEAYLRTPDAASRSALIEDRFGATLPDQPLPGIQHPAVSAAYAGLWTLHQLLRRSFLRPIRRVLDGSVRFFVQRGLELMGREFVMAQTISLAVKKARSVKQTTRRFSFDMLGEGAVTEADADRYFERYLTALKALSDEGDVVARKDGISVKLSALHPAYDLWHWPQTRPIMLSRMKTLCLLAKEKQIGLNIDAEEYARLDLGLDVLKTLADDPELRDWDGLGIVIQAYHCRAYEVLTELIAFLDGIDRRIMIRLVKGAYWDTEIKLAQTLGVSDFPVFTRKAHTDISYLACARLMLRRTDVLYPQFATHNAKTMADIWQMAMEYGVPPTAFEFQRLYGMGAALHDEIQTEGVRSRVYAPIGSYRDLLAYLVRRLLENAANTSFISQLADPRLSLSELIESPVNTVRWNPNVSRPQTGAELFLPRHNARGYRVDVPTAVTQLQAELNAIKLPVADGSMSVMNPATGEVVGAYEADTSTSIAIKSKSALNVAEMFATRMDRSTLLLQVAELYEAHHLELLAVLQREAGKTLLDAIGELREAVDFLRFYASRPETLQQSEPGIAVCISPWNFPLAIFTGQIAAAFAAGRAVLAKPAEQTTLCAQLAIALWSRVLPHESIVQLICGDGAVVGPELLRQPGVVVVAFTGSTETARAIRNTLARSTNFRARLIAETGGLNACIADSTALPEQLVRDVVGSAFQSAGQRCSACRVLLVQSEIYDEVCEMLVGAMRLLVHGDPTASQTDVGPVIDRHAQAQLEAYIASLSDHVLYQCNAPRNGHFVPATLMEIQTLDSLEREQFGPILHVLRYQRRDLPEHLESLMSKGYALTGAIQSRNEQFIADVRSRFPVGNLYVNRNQIGAVVESQPFGGEGLSGTGPKAGGPHYVSAFMPQMAKPSEGTEIAWTDESNPALYQRIEQALIQQTLQIQSAPLRSHRCPGPTGEQNELFEHARGVWLAVGNHSAPLVELALQTGNRVVWLRSDAPRPDRTADVFVIDSIHVIPLDSLKTLPFDGVLAMEEPEVLQEIEIRLSERHGPIVPLVWDQQSKSHFIRERHVSINTTASGGNPGLLLSAAQ